MSSRSICAKEAITLKKKRSEAVVVSISQNSIRAPSATIIETPDRHRSTVWDGIGSWSR